MITPFNPEKREGDLKRILYCECFFVCFDIYKSQNKSRKGEASSAIQSTL